MEESKISIVGKAQEILNQVHKAVVGKDSVLLWTLAAILSGGHVLVEDIPGVGKTTMALAFSRVLGLDYNRIQFTPDVLPSDVTGYSVLNQASGELEFKPGAVMCNLLLADELNRATSRTQSALLEAMEEGQVTVDGVSYPLPNPFIVMATQNPAGAAGTQLLPDSQMDRFSVRISMGYPAPKDEVLMVMQRQGKDPLRALEPVVSAEELTEMQQIVAQTHVSEEIARYVVNLVEATRCCDQLTRGASPRATLAVVAMAKAVARLRGRDYLVPKDVQEVFVTTVAHRLHLAPHVDGQVESPREVLRTLISKVQPPKLR